MPGCSYEDESRLFDENWVEVSTKDRMHMWDRRWAYLKSFPQVCDCWINGQVG